MLVTILARWIDLDTQRTLYLNVRRSEGYTVAIWMDAALELGRIWEEGKDKWISLSDLSYPLECYTQILFPGGDKHPFSCFACSNLEFSSYSQINTVFTTMECFAMLSNLHYSEIWTHVKSRHCTHEAWYHFVTQITRWILNPRVVIVFSKFSTKL